jgi:predicted acyltransferase
LLTAGDGALTLEGNLVRITDLALFGENHIYKGYGLPFDPEGLLSTIPAIGTILLGYLAGRHMMDFTTNQEKIQWLLMFGVGGIIIGLIWSALGFPINKPIWSSSYVLYTGGLAMVLLACMIWVIDVHKIQHWTYVFKAFGQNPLVCYALSGVIVKTILLIHIGEKNLYAWSYDTFYQAVFGNYLGSLMFALSFVLLIWAFAWWMDRKGMIVKV